ncbi:MAG: YigZ family protein [Lachnospiraceae bacterium]|nr:YigZ family protein [Lachnospiraceae bacterium]
MADKYRTVEPGKIYAGEYTEKKSRFIAALTGVGDLTSAREFINGLKKKYYDARHNVSAYILRSETGTFEEGSIPLSHSSDDGEPPGTAGKPILEVLTGEALTDVCLVVTRYFGGTLLGTGGLVRAYSTAAKEAVLSADIVEMRPSVRTGLRFSYANEGGVRRLMENFGAVLEGSEYGTDVSFTVYVPEEKSGEFERAVINNFSGQAQISLGEVEFFPFKML